MIWLWIGLGLLGAALVAFALWFVRFVIPLRERMVNVCVRTFQEKPLFIVPRGQPIAGAEDVSFPTTDGLKLRGCWLKGSGNRRGVILFGLEYGSNRWFCHSYCEHLLAHGFDVFTFEPRNQGDSDCLPGYDPLQWVTHHEVADFRAALAWLKSRPEADPRGVGFFGISKGGGAGLLAFAREPYVRCFVTDGAFATLTTVLPYMRRWAPIFTRRKWLQKSAPDWLYALVSKIGLERIGHLRNCRFLDVESAMARVAPRPLLMIHGGADNYIKPAMAQALFDRAGPPKEFWLVEGAKHNQAITVAGDEYRRRVLGFFEKHLAEPVQARTKPLFAAML